MCNNKLLNIILSILLKCKCGVPCSFSDGYKFRMIASHVIDFSYIQIPSRWQDH